MKIAYNGFLYEMAIPNSIILSKEYYHGVYNYKVAEFVLTILFIMIPLFRIFFNNFFNIFKLIINILTHTISYTSIIKSPFTSAFTST